MQNRVLKSQNTTNVWLNQYFSLVVAGCLIFALLISYFFILGPKYHSTQEAIQATLDQQEDIFLSSRIKLANLETLGTLYKKMDQSDLQKFNTILPDEYPPERLFGELEEIVSRGGWLITDISITEPGATLDGSAASAPAPVAAEDELSGEDGATQVIVSSGARPSAATPESLGQFSVELSVGSIDYAGFKNLIKLLETNLRLFDITSVDFTPGDNASFVLTTYYYKKNS